METTSYFSFWCKHCQAVRRLTGDKLRTNHKYCGLTHDDEYYETHVICPVCKKKLVFRERSIYSYLKNEWRDITNA